MPSSSAGDILHFTGVRLRITGSGNLIQKINSLDDITTYNMVNLALAAATDREPLTLANYINQRGQYVLRTTEINEYFNISKIVIFVKTIYSGYPQ